MLNRFLYNQSQYNQAVAAASSIDAGATRSPFGHIMVAAPGGDLVLIYQEGLAGEATDGLVYRVSTNGGSVWGAQRVISSRTDVYASAIIDSNRHIHVVYSAHGDPPQTDEGVFYRPLVWDTGVEDWFVGGEQTLAGGGSVYDPAIAGRRNATISVGDDNFPVITYLRNEGGVVSWAMLISQEVDALTDLDVDLDIGVAADEDSRGAMQQSDTRTVYFVSRTGSSYSIATAVITNPMAALGVDLTVFDSWFGSETEHIAIAVDDQTPQTLAVIYFEANTGIHLRRFNLDTNAFISDMAVLAPQTPAVDSVSITWDGARFWMATVADDIVRLTNSDNPLTVITTFANPGIDEDWSFLNSPVSSVDSQRIVFTWSSTLSGFRIYVGTHLVDRDITEAETGVGVDVAQIDITEAETGVGVDTVTAIETIVVNDFSINQNPQGMYNQKNLLFNTEEYNQAVEGIELGVTVGPLVADTGVGVDAEVKAIVEVETGTGVDAVTIGLSSPDTGAGADNAVIPTENIDTSDTGSGDGETDSLDVQVTEAGVGALTEAMGTTVAETGVGVDVAEILLGPEADTGSGADSESHGPTVADTGVGVDAFFSLDKQGEAEAGVGVDVAIIGVSSPDTGVGADLVGQGQEINITAADTGVGLDVVTQTWIPTAVVVRLLASLGETRLKLES